MRFVYLTILYRLDLLHSVELQMSVCGLFNDSVSSSDYVASNDRMINE
jgi:hypothetical protein